MLLTGKEQNEIILSDRKVRIVLIDIQSSFMDQNQNKLLHAALAVDKSVLTDKSAGQCAVDMKGRIVYADIHCFRYAPLSAVLYES